MFKSDYEKSIVLLGPKGVGKSLIANTLAKKFGINKVVSTDFLRSVLVMYNRGDLFNFANLKEQVEKVAKKERISIKAPTSKVEELLETQQRDMDEYFKKLYNTAKVLGALKPNKKLDELSHKVASIQEAQEKHGVFSANQYNFLMQYFLFELVIMYLNTVNEPIVLDMGADLGVKYQLSPNEIMEIAPLFKPNFGQVLNTQKNLLEKFKMRVALVPEGEYYNSADPKVGDKQNKGFLNHLNDYIDFANIMASADGFSYDISHPAYKKNGHFYTYEDEVRDKLKNKGEINNLCDQIRELIYAYNDDDTLNTTSPTKPIKR